MIEFERVRLKNFMSYGNAWTEMPLNKHKMTVIVGKNGGGKSTILSSICFALYGKPFNDAQKSRIVNTINEKNLLVEIWFKSGGISYMVRRGIKPNIFQIYRNDVLINQESSVKNYQEILEKQILKINLKTFKQTILIGTASFTPFMEMSANDRRIVIENILGVEVLSTMNTLIKQKDAENRGELERLKNAIEKLKIQINSEKAQIDTLKNVTKTSKEKYNEEIEKTSVLLKKHQEVVEKATASLEKLLPYKDAIDDVKKSRNELNLQISSIKSLIKNSKKQLAFVQSHDFCPICQQTISDVHRKDISDRTTSEMDKNQKEIDSIQGKIDVYSEKEEKLQKVIDKISELNMKIAESNIKINYLKNAIDKAIYERDKPQETTDTIEKHKEHIVSLAEDGKILLEQKETAVNEKQLIEASQTLLKDSGIKATIVSQFLPLINRKVNEYLDAMEFFISFTLDNEFNEMIKSRERDEFKYQNLSQGERRRLDMALILTWRYIISKRAEFDTNLLFLDEVLDGGLDYDGCDSVMNLLRSLDNNIIIITHNEKISDTRIDSYLKVDKVNQFSVLKTTTPD